MVETSQITGFLLDVWTWYYTGLGKIIDYIFGTTLDNLILQIIGGLILSVIVWLLLPEKK